MWNKIEDSKQSNFSSETFTKLFAHDALNVARISHFRVGIFPVADERLFTLEDDLYKKNDKSSTLKYAYVFFLLLPCWKKSTWCGDI